MKMKNDVVVIIILLIICFVVIPIISRLFVQEGFYNPNTIEVNRVLKSVKGPNGPMDFNSEAITKYRDRIEFKDVSNFMNSKEDRPGQDISYNFCIGKLKCDSGYEMKKLPFKDNDNTNLYYPYCVNGNNLKELRCEDGLKNKTREGDAFDASGFTPNFSFNRYQPTDNPFYFKQYDVNANKTGLKWLKNVLECDYIADNRKRVACTNEESRTRSGSSSSGTDAAYLKDIFKALTEAAKKSDSDTTSKPKRNAGSGEPIKCVADFGTKIGDNLCCGQTGVLQDTKYTCPNTLPYCSDFKCGSKFGTCRK